MKITYLFFALVLLVSVGCNNQPAKETKTETVKVVEVEAAPAKESETTISVGPNGGSVKTKKVDVKVETNN